MQILSASAICLAMDRASFTGIGPCDPVGKSRTLDQLHDQGADAVGFLQAVDVRDMWVVQGCEDFSVTLEASQALRVGSQCFGRTLIATARFKLLSMSFVTQCRETVSALARQLPEPGPRGSDEVPAERANSWQGGCWRLWEPRHAPARRRGTPNTRGARFPSRRQGERDGAREGRPKRHLMRFLSRARRWIVWTVCGQAVLVSLFVLALPWSTRYPVNRVAVLLSDRYDIDLSASILGRIRRSPVPMTRAA